LLFAVCCLLSAVCCLLFAVCCLLFAVYCLLSAVCCLLFCFLHPYELFINCLALSYTTERRSLCVRKVVNQKHLRKLEESTGIFCFIAGLVAPVLGGFLAMAEWIVESADHRWLHVASTALFIVGIPLILFAGFCLDWAERGQKKSPQATPISSNRTIRIRTG
jgi:hypothetical protein